MKDFPDVNEKEILDKIKAEQTSEEKENTEEEEKKWFYKLIYATEIIDSVQKTNVLAWHTSSWS